ncbi:MAG TPA: alpha/beta hydrolase [Galbitalea sp.]
MKPLPRWFRAFVRIVGALAPPLMVAITYRMFWNLGKPMTVRADALPVHTRAQRETLAIGERTAVVYRWGTGPETVLLVHGWRGRASQFAALIDALESPERTIVAFDAPGNGDSPGDRTDLRDYLAVIRAVADGAGGLDLLVGHSFGVMGIFVAVREGVRANRMVSIAGTADMNSAYATFAHALELPRRVDVRLRRKIERQVFDGDTGIWRRFVSELEPTDQTPLLIIHDRDDRTVELSQAERIASAHLGPTTEVYTSGLGHTRVLSDPRVLQAIARFASESVRTRSAGE